MAPIKTELTDLRKKLRDGRKQNQMETKQNDATEIIDEAKYAIAIVQKSEPVESVIAPILIQSLEDEPLTGDMKIEAKQEGTLQDEAEDGEIVEKLESEEITKPNEATEECKPAEVADKCMEEIKNLESSPTKNTTESEGITTEKIQPNAPRTPKNRKRTSKPTELRSAKQKKIDADHVLASSQSHCKPEKENGMEVEVIAGSAIENATMVTELKKESSNSPNVEENVLNLNPLNAIDTPGDGACFETTTNTDKLNNSKENHCSAENAITENATEQIVIKTENASPAELNNTNKFDQSEYKSVKNVSTSSTDYVIVEDENSDITIFVTRKKKKKKSKKKEKN